MDLPIATLNSVFRRHQTRSAGRLVNIFLLVCCLGFIGTSVSFLLRTNNQQQMYMRSSASLDTGFVPLNPESLSATTCLIEQTLCQPSAAQPQLARDVDYASAVLDAWRQEEAETGETWMTEWKAVTYNSDDGTPLYGHIVRRKKQSKETHLSGILLFHTGAGPHDVFLLWKAASLVMSLDCEVLITDILSDESGWAWQSDRTRYETARNDVLKVLPGEGSRPILQKRIHAAVSFLKDRPDVDADRLAALGWCLGGHSILELGRMNVHGILAMVTFHGIFDGISPPMKQQQQSSDTAEVLVCHGLEDPFVTSHSLEIALETFQHYGHRLSLLQFKDAKHGFTNPAQDYNDNPSFEFHQESASKSWHQAIALLKRKCAMPESSVESGSR